MMQTQVAESHPTTRVFPRTLQEAYPKHYVNEGVFEGPYRDPHLSDFSILCALIAIVGFFFYMFSKYIWG